MKQQYKFGVLNYSARKFGAKVGNGLVHFELSNDENFFSSANSMSSWLASNQEGKFETVLPEVATLFEGTSVRLGQLVQTGLKKFTYKLIGDFSLAEYRKIFG